MLWLIFLLFAAVFLPLFLTVWHFVNLIKLLLMDATEAKRTRRSERVLRSAIIMAIALFVSYCVFRNEDLELILSGMNVVVLLVYGLFLFVVPGALLVWFGMALRRFVQTAKDETDLRRRRKIRLIVASCIAWTIIPAEVILVYIPMMEMPMM